MSGQSPTLDALREVIAAGFKSMRGFAQKITIPLPGPDWEPFPLSTGEPVWWCQEPISKGRLCRFRGTGPSSIGYHFHDTAEVVTVASGRVFLQINGVERVLLPGETYTAQPHELHGARLDSPAEALAHWTYLEADEIEIGYYPP